MRKAYQKPEIMFEDFSLSTNIAGDCEGEFVKNPVRGSCGVPLNDGTTVFVDRDTGCDIEMGQNYVHDGLCYHVPYESGNLFNS